MKLNKLYFINKLRLKNCIKENQIAYFTICDNLQIFPNPGIRSDPKEGHKSKAHQIIRSKDGSTSRVWASDPGQSGSDTSTNPIGE